MNYKWLGDGFCELSFYHGEVPQLIPSGCCGNRHHTMARQTRTLLNFVVPVSYTVYHLECALYHGLHC